MASKKNNRSDNFSKRFKEVVKKTWKTLLYVR